MAYIKHCTLASNSLVYAFKSSFVGDLAQPGNATSTYKEDYENRRRCQSESTFNPVDVFILLECYS